MPDMYDELVSAFIELSHHGYFKTHSFGYNVEEKIGHTLCFNCFEMRPNVHMCLSPSVCKCLDTRCRLARN